jgi:hypothetical protein
LFVKKGAAQTKPRVDVAAASLWWPAGIVLVVALVVYLRTCARTVTLVDSSEMILVRASLGVAHPPGFPAYTMIGHLFSLVPVGSVALRLAAAVACGGTAMAVEPSSSNAHAILGNFELEAGGLDAARIAHRGALREDPKNREATSQLEQLARTIPG